MHLLDAAFDFSFGAKFYAFYRLKHRRTVFFLRASAALLHDSSSAWYTLACALAVPSQLVVVDEVQCQFSPRTCKSTYTLRVMFALSSVE